MSNGENYQAEAGSSNDFLKKFRFETKGYCFVCFSEIEGYAGDGGDNSSTSVSLHKTFRHLKVDIRKVIEKLAGGTGAPNIPSSTYSTLLKQTEIIASLCNNCRTVEETLVELVEMEEKIRLEKLVCLEQIQGRLQEPERNRSREQEYRKRMTSDIRSMLFLWIVGGLRKEVIEKCQIFTSCGQPTSVNVGEPSSTSPRNDGEEQNGRQKNGSSHFEQNLELKTEMEQESNTNTTRKEAVITAGDVMLVDISSHEEEEDQEQTPLPSLPIPEAPSTSAPIPGPATQSKYQTCPVCPAQFRFSFGLNKHMKKTGHGDPVTHLGTKIVPPNVPSFQGTWGPPIPPNNPPDSSGPAAAAEAEAEKVPKATNKSPTIHSNKRYEWRENLGREKEKPSFECNICSRKFPHLWYLVKHRAETHFQARFQCDRPRCGESFSGKDSLVLHKKMEHEGEPEVSNKPEVAAGSSSSLPIPSPPASPIVSEEAYSVDLFPAPASQAAQAPLEDPLQFLPYDSLPSARSELEVIENTNDGDKQVPCSSTIQNTRSDKENRSPRCDLCRQTYSSQTNLRIHRVTCDGTPRRYGTPLHECRLCWKRFWNPRELAGHRRLAHLSAQRFPCGTCGKEFKYKETMARHIRSFHNGITFQCKAPGCGNRFRNRNYLKTHEKTKHSVSEQGLPETFPAATEKTDLVHKVHFTDMIRIVEGNGEVPGPSGTTGSVSVNPSGDHGQCLATNGNISLTIKVLEKRRIGILVPALVCIVCGKNYSAEQFLDQHMKTVHLGHRYECPVSGCGESYSYPGGLRRHMKRAHQAQRMPAPWDKGNFGNIAVLRQQLLGQWDSLDGGNEFQDNLR